VHPFALTTQCVNCHRGDLRDSDFLGSSAANVWAEHDKHRQAFELLKKEAVLVRRMLGFELAEAFTDETLTVLRTDDDPQVRSKVATVRQCLNCHATATLETDEQRPPLSLGVSCQACHGRGGDWSEPHQLEWWRLVTPEAKHAMGFRDVRDPAERARLCASCHIGNLAEGKFVKHDWYAAGHPPLPSFEYSTFAAYMPVHWKPLAEKGDFRGRDAGSPAPRSLEQSLAAFLKRHKLPETAVRATYREANFPREKFAEHDPFTDLQRCKDTVIAGAVVLDTYAQLLKDYSLAARSPEPSARREWPEFALYDCASCHHELRSGPGLPDRPFGKNPIGRPPAQVWPMALLNLAFLQSVQYEPHAGKAWFGKLTLLQLDFERSLTTTVFGKPEDIAASADALRAELAPLIDRLKTSRYDEVAARHALLILTNKSQVETRDFHSARQIAWSIREITKDLSRLPYDRAAAEPRLREIERLFDMPAEPNTLPQDIFLLRLPATQQESIVGNLPRLSAAMKDFDSAKFAARLAELHQQLQQSTKP